MDEIEATAVIVGAWRRAVRDAEVETVDEDAAE